MMTNLFSIFDPSTNIYLSMNWFMVMMVLMFIPLIYWLKLFMVMIETISHIICPWTLSIRLTANVLAGHLLLSLMGSSMNNLFLLILPLMIIIQNMLFILEISVSMIQSYVFSILSLLYFNDSN